MLASEIRAALIRRASQIPLACSDIGLIVHAMGIMKCENEEWSAIKPSIISNLESMTSVTMVTCFHCLCFARQSTQEDVKAFQNVCREHLTAMPVRELATMAHACGKVPHFMLSDFKDELLERIIEVLPTATKSDLIPLIAGAAQIHIEHRKFFSQAASRLQEIVDEFSISEITALLSELLSTNITESFKSMLMSFVPLLQRHGSELNAEQCATLMLAYGKSNINDANSVKFYEVLAQRSVALKEEMEWHHQAMIACCIAKVKLKSLFPIGLQFLNLCSRHAEECGANTLISLLQALASFLHATPTTPQAVPAQFKTALSLLLAALAARRSSLDSRDEIELLRALCLFKPSAGSSIDAEFNMLQKSVFTNLGRYTTVDLVLLFCSLAPSNRESARILYDKLESKEDWSALPTPYIIRFVHVMSNIGITGLRRYVQLLRLVLDDSISGRQLSAKEAVLILSTMSKMSLRRTEWMQKLCQPFSHQDGSLPELSFPNAALLIKSLGILGFRPNNIVDIVTQCVEQHSTASLKPIEAVNYLIGVGELSCIRYPQVEKMFVLLQSIQPLDLKTSRLVSRFLSSLVQTGVPYSSILSTVVLSFCQTPIHGFADVLPLALSWPMVSQRILPSERKKVISHLNEQLAERLRGLQHLQTSENTFLFTQLAVAIRFRISISSCKGDADAHNNFIKWVLSLLPFLKLRDLKSQKELVTPCMIIASYLAAQLDNNGSVREDHVLPLLKASVPVLRYARNDQLLLRVANFFAAGQQLGPRSMQSHGFYQELKTVLTKVAGNQEHYSVVGTEVLIKLHQALQKEKFFQHERAKDLMKSLGEKFCVAIQELPYLPVSSCSRYLKHILQLEVSSGIAESSCEVVLTSTKRFAEISLRDLERSMLKKDDVCLEKRDELSYRLDEVIQLLATESSAFPLKGERLEFFRSSFLDLKEKV